MQLFGVDHHNYSFLGWTIPSNVRRNYAFNAAQDKATQKKKTNPEEWFLINKTTESPCNNLFTLKRSSICLSGMSQNSHFKPATNPAFSHWAENMVHSAFFFQTFFLQPNLPHLYENMSLPDTIYSCRRHKNTLGGGVIPTCQDIKSGIKDAILKDQ